MNNLISLGNVPFYKDTHGYHSSEGATFIATFNIDISRNCLCISFSNRNEPFLKNDSEIECEIDIASISRAISLINTFPKYSNSKYIILSTSHYLRSYNTQKPLYLNLTGNSSDTEDNVITCVIMHNGKEHAFRIQSHYQINVMRDMLKDSLDIMKNNLISSNLTTQQTEVPSAPAAI